MNCTEGDMERKKNVGEKGEDSLEGTVGRLSVSCYTVQNEVLVVGYGRLSLRPIFR